MKWLSTRLDKYWGLRLSLILVAFMAFGFGAAARADSFVQSFRSSVSLQPGWVVSVDPKDTGSVKAASANSSANIYGVVIDPTQAPATVQHEGQQVFVANSGNYPVLVSSQNGVIKPGDYISLSSVNGIGAKATAKQNIILGQALQGFDAKKGVLTTESGGAAIGQVTVSISPQKNPLLKDAVAVPSALRSVVQTVGGNSTSAVRIYSAVLIFVICTIVACSLLYVGVRSGITAVGRNPLSKHSIIRSLGQVTIVAILVFVVGLFGVYLLLRL